MPKVVVYVPAAAWRRLEERGLDPAQAVRDFARSGYDLIDAGPVELQPAGTVLSERGAKEHATEPTSQSMAHRLPRSESADDHFKPDFKKGKK